MIKTIIVVGGGSAGFLAAITLKTWFPQLKIQVIRSKEIGIIGVGEGCTPTLVDHLHGTLSIDPGEFYRAVDPIWKLGIKFHWGKRPQFNYTFAFPFDFKVDGLPKAIGYYCEDDFSDDCQNSALMSRDRAFVRDTRGDPVIGKNIAYHLENEKFVRFLETHATRVDVDIIDDTIKAVEQGEVGVASLKLRSGQSIAADLFVDASGFNSLLLGKTLQEPFISFNSSLFCDRAVVGGWDSNDGPIQPYTVAETMNSGWCWRIDHEHRINRGYVYSSAFISDEEAEAEFRKQNPLITQTRVVRFQTGRYVNSWVKNVVAIGNAQGFVEPLEATSLSVICHQARGLILSLTDCDFQPQQMTRTAFNNRAASLWDSIRQFLAIHYRFNERVDTPFWRECREKTELGDADSIVEYYRENGPSTMPKESLCDSFDPFALDGYMILLQGQRVPYRRTHTPTPAELTSWEGHRRQVAGRAANGVTVREALDRVRSPDWKWRPGFYGGGRA